MSTPSIRASVYSCNAAKVNGEHATRAQSARFFDPALNVVSTACRSANENHAGRPAGQNSDNGLGTYGAMAGMAGLNPSDWILLTTGLRQVDFQSQGAQYGTSFYDTIGGANRSNWLSQFAGAGKTCGLYAGPNSYTSSPQENNCYGQFTPKTSVDRSNYMRALNQVYRDNSLGQY